MKWHITLLTLAGLTAGAEIRTFTAADGRTLKAEITQYNAAKKQVEIRREDGKTLSVAPSAFSEHDQTYIRKWAAAQVFMNPSQFSLTLKRKELESSKKEHEVEIGEEFSGGRRGGGESGMVTVAIDKQTKYTCELTLENKSEIQLNNMMLEYRLYYDQQKAVLDEKANKGRPDDSSRPEWHMAEDQLKIKDGKNRLKPATGNSTRTVSTTSITLTERSANRGWGDKIDLKANFHGAWARLTMIGPDGETLERDVATSNSIMKKFPWDAPEELETTEEAAD